MISLPNTSEFWRMFCAIALPPQVSKRAHQHIRELRHSFPNVRVSWTRDDKFHLTVIFLGEIPRERVANLSNAAARATASLAPFKLIIEHAGAFPAKGPAKVLWLGVSDVESGLKHLHARLEHECEQEGFGKEERPFQPHLTLARLRESKDARALAARHKEIGFAGAEIAVTELLVIRSELSSSGSKYTVVSRHMLRGQ